MPNADNIFLLQQLFVALVHPASGGTGFAPDYERVNYDNSINLLQVNGGALSDQFYVDDNSAITVLDGVAGDDTFQFGQVFGTDPTAATAVAPGDEIATVDTTVRVAQPRRQLRHDRVRRRDPGTGAFYQLNQADGSGDAAGLYQWNGAAWVPSTSTAPGGTPSGTALPGRGDATFTVYSNKATLKLFGEGGNNTFIVRAFLIISTGQSATSQTDITTGNGNNQIEYNINAPVAIDGGSGFNTLLIIGTDANDTFVITKDGIMGAGLNVSYTNIEKIEVDGEGGNDTFDVLSTDPDADHRPGRRRQAPTPSTSAATSRRRSSPSTPTGPAASSTTASPAPTRTTTGSSPQACRSRWRAPPRARSSSASRPAATRWSRPRPAPRRRCRPRARPPTRSRWERRARPTGRSGT